MADSCELQCEPCLHENVSKSASKWCTDCEESLCDDCSRWHKAHKMSKNHHVIPSHDYKQTEKLNINLECENHSEQLDFYCPTHDSVICFVCIQSNHDDCYDLKPLDKVAKDAKESTDFTDMEQTIDGLLEDIENEVRHLQLHKTNLKEQADIAKKCIKTKRAEINRHLDRIEETILKELKSKLEKAENEISVMTANFEIRRNNIMELKDTIQNMKQFASNLQVFIGFRSILNTFVNEIDEIELLVSSNLQLSVIVQINPKFDAFTEIFNTLGEIEILSEEAIIPYVKQRIIQTRYQSPSDPPFQKLENLQLKLRGYIDIGNSYVKSCLILPNKSIVIASYNKPSLTILNEDGSHNRDISIPYTPYDVTKIVDQWVAVSYFNKHISIVNVNTQNTIQTLEYVCSQGINGITYNDGKLYAVEFDEGINVIDLEGNIISTIPIYKDTCTWDTWKVISHKDRVYYSDTNGSVHCVDMDGKEMWTCQDDRLKSEFYNSPAIAVDNNGITFATGREKNVLLAISPDGSQQKVLLTSSDGLLSPNAVYFDKDSERLLICNYQNGHAALYEIIY